MPALFELGQIVFTPGAVELLSKPGAQFRTLLARHATGDWGNLSDADKAENDLSVKEGYRIFSMYEVLGEKLYIITEADRSATTFLLPSEY